MIGNSSDPFSGRSNFPTADSIFSLLINLSQLEMDGMKVTKRNIDNQKKNKIEQAKLMVPAFSNLLVQLPQKIQNCLESGLKGLTKSDQRQTITSSALRSEKPASTDMGISLEKQLQAWKENPIWVDQPPNIKVSVPKGSLCNLNVQVDVGLPPDAVYNIVTDPDNKRVFKNIKEVVSRKVLVDEGLRQVVELEQSAIWRFLWWSGTISVHVLVDQNREDHSMKFKQLKTGFMKKFEGCWRVEPLFVDEKVCFPFKPKTWAEYCSCTGGKGRIGSNVSLEQLIQPSIVPPAPISWYLRGITARTTEMLITDLVAETARIRGVSSTGYSDEEIGQHTHVSDECPVNQLRDIKQRWALRRRNARQCYRKF